MPRKKKKDSNWLWFWLALLAVCIGSGFLVFRYKNKLDQTIGEYSKSASPRTETLKFESVFDRFPEGILGIDISQYQGKINFSKLSKTIQNQEIEFVFIRATMGDDGIDSRFTQNWKGFDTTAIKRGAYHYYRPNENSTRQAENFIKNVRLRPGDLIPVLDIEKHSSIQSRDKLREGLKNWLRIVEEHYGVKPMIYTGDRFFWEVLHNEGFDDYPIWVANYNRVVQPETKNWMIWQFTEKGKLTGISENIDLNILKGGRFALQKLKMPI